MAESDSSALDNFMGYFRRLLGCLEQLQDMNSQQRAVMDHVLYEPEWISTFKVMPHLVSILKTTAQVASTSRELLLEAIQATREVCSIQKLPSVSPLMNTLAR